MEARSPASSTEAEHNNRKDAKFAKDIAERVEAYSAHFSCTEIASTVMLGVFSVCRDGGQVVF